MFKNEYNLLENWKLQHEQYLSRNLTVVWYLVVNWWFICINAKNYSSFNVITSRKNQKQEYSTQTKYLSNISCLAYGNKSMFNKIGIFESEFNKNSLDPIF